MQKYKENKKNLKAAEFETASHGKRPCAVITFFFLHRYVFTYLRASILINNLWINEVIKNLSEEMLALLHKT